jgi:hypothetical protein
MKTPVAITHATAVSVSPLSLAVILITFSFPSCSQFFVGSYSVEAWTSCIEDQIILTLLGDVVNQFLISFWSDILFLTDPFWNSIISQLAT